MRKTSGPVLFLLALLVVGAVAGVTAGAVFLLDLDEDDTAFATTTTTVPTATTTRPLTATQTAVIGSLTLATIEGIRFPAIPTPIVVSTPEAGQGAGGIIQLVTIGGEPTVINWDAGRPFDLQGEGRALLPSMVNLILGPALLRVGFPDETGFGFDPGSYTLATPVAVAFGDGLASPRDSVAFDATPESVGAFRGSAFTDLAPHDLVLAGPGRVVLEGALTITRPDGTTAPASRVELDEAPFELTLVPLPDGSGWSVDGLLQGVITIT